MRSSARHAFAIVMLAVVAVVPLACGSGGDAKQRAPVGSPAQLVYATVDAPGGDLDSVVSRLYIATPGEQPALIRAYPGHQLYEMLASPTDATSR